MMQFRVKGYTDDVTDCQRDGCPMRDLKMTVVLAILDEDGNEEDYTYYGTDCAAKALGFTQPQIRKEARTADKAADAAFYQWKDAMHTADMAASTAALARLGLQRNVRNMDVVDHDETYLADIAAWRAANPAPIPSARTARNYAHLINAA